MIEDAKIGMFSIFILFLCHFTGWNQKPNNITRSQLLNLKSRSTSTWVLVALWLVH